MPNVGSRTVQAKETVGGTTFKNFVNIQAFSGGWKNVKKMFVHNGSGWTEVWNNRPVTTTGDGSSSDYDRITLTGTVNPNNFDATPRFYYKKASDSAYTADSELTAVSGNTAQSVGSRTVTGLVENTKYNFYLSATNAAGTSDTPTVKEVTTPYDCRTVANGGQGWSSSSTTSTGTCGTCGSYTRTVTTYTKSGCSNSPYSVTSDTACSESTCGCASPNTNGWSATQTRTRNVACGTNCGLQQQTQEYITKSGCTEVITRDWYDSGAGCINELGYQDVSGSQVEGGYFAGIQLRVGTYGFFGPTAIYTYTCVNCGLTCPNNCCGGTQIKYYKAEQCSYVPTAQRWTLLGCFSAY